MLCLAAPLGAQAGDPPGAAAPSKTLDNGAMRVTLSQGREAPGWFIAATTSVNRQLRRFSPIH
jgi:hypothetical protein